MAKYLILRGTHCERNEAGVDVTYKPGDVVETTNDLEQHNDPQNPKFKKLDK